MFRPERNASPFSLLDMDMWDSNLTAQSSAWCGMASVSGSEFMSKVNTSSTLGSGSYRQTDPGLRKWQSLSHLAPNVSPRSFSPSPSSSLRSGRVQSPFRQTGVMQWLQEAHEKMDSHMDLLRTDPRLSSAGLNIKPKEGHSSDAELFKLKHALIDAELRAKRQEGECKQTLQKLQAATEAQKTQLSQTAELKQKLTESIQNQSELQDQLREANNKISQACLEKATLSTQVLKLEDTVHVLMTKLSAALHDKDDLAQERADLQEKAHLLELQLEKNVQSTEGCEQPKGLDPTQTDAEETAFLKQEVATLKQSNRDLTNEHDAMKQTLKESQVQLQELTTEKAKKEQQIIDLDTQCAELISKIQKGEQECMEELRGQIMQLRASSRSLKWEKQRQQERCLFLETDVLEKEQQLKLLQDKHHRADAVKVQHIEKLQGAVTHWTEKWQKAALELQCTEAKPEELRKKNKSESEALLRLELDACKQELELVKIRSQALLNKERDGGDIETQDKETLTDSCLLSPAFHLGFQSTQGEQLEKQTAGCEDEGSIDAQIIESLKVELGESKQMATQLEQEKIAAEQKHQQQPLAKDERPCAEDRRGVETDTEQQRRLVNEQLKQLFKEKEGDDLVRSEDAPNQDWVQMPRGTRGPLHDRWIWHQGAGLMPVFEEEEPGDEDQDAEKRSRTFSGDTSEPWMKRDTQAFQEGHVNLLTLREKISGYEAQYCEPQEPDMLITKGLPTIKGLDAFAEQPPQSCTDVSKLHKTWPLFCPDGIFHVEMVDICSPDEDEED